MRGIKDNSSFYRVNSTNISTDFSVSFFFN